MARERDFEVVGELYHVGARFKALDESVLTAPSVLSCIFFTILTLLSEQCACRDVVPGLLTAWSCQHNIGMFGLTTKGRSIEHRVNGLS